MKRSMGGNARRNAGRWILSGLILSLSAGMIAGCGGGGGTGEAADKSKTDTAEPADKKLNPMSISVVTNGQNLKFPDGMDITNNPYMDYIRKNTNLDIKFTLPQSDGFDEKLNVIMASGDLPDLISTSNASWFVNYVNQKALMPLNDVIDKYAPELKKRIPQEAWDNVTIDGKIYAIPTLNEAPGGYLMYGRKDWLDRVGLKPPKTIDEYYEVIKAFAEKDPDGNGKNDTIGISLRENLGGSSPLFGAFGTQVSLNSWFEKNGQLVNGTIMPETKEALAFFAKLYKEKLLDQEFMLNKANVFSEKIANGKIGLYSATWSDTRGPIETNRKNDPKAEWIPFEFPVGKDGKKGTAASQPVRFYNVIPASSKNAEGVLRLLDFLSGKGYRDVKLGFEHQVWIKKDGKIEINFEEHNKHFYRGLYANLADIADPAVTKDRLDGLGLQFNLNDNLVRIGQNLNKSAYAGTPTPAMGKYGAKLDKDMQETFTKIVVGAAPITEFDAFVDRWKKEGGEAVTSEVNDWYKQRKK